MLLIASPDKWLKEKRKQENRRKSPTRRSIGDKSSLIAAYANLGQNQKPSRLSGSDSSLLAVMLFSRFSSSYLLALLDIKHH